MNSTLKKIVFTTSFVIFILFQSHAQFNINGNPYWKGEIKLLDGTMKKGFVKVPNSSKEDYVAYRSSMNGDKETVKRKNIDYVKVSSESGNHYVYENIPAVMTIKGNSSIGTSLLLVAAKNNYVTFYVQSGVYKVDKEKGEIYILDRYNYGKDLPIVSYYIRKKSEEKAHMFAQTGNNIIGLNGKLKKSAKHNLAEVPGLVKKIEEKELRHTDIPEIIQQYVDSTRDM